MSDTQSPPFPGVARGSFPTTHWSVVHAAGAGSESVASAALETLCRQYWYPIYAYVRRSGRLHHEAEDCTQEFLARLIASHGFARARPERGRFRTYLLTAVRHFLINEWQRGLASKRGGGSPMLSLDWPDAARRFVDEPTDGDLSPEQWFDRAWAQQLFERTIGELRHDYEKRGQGALFAALGALVWGSGSEETQTQLADQLGMKPHAFTVALQRLRRRLGERLRARVAETVTGPADIDSELRHLLSAIAGAREK